MASFDPSVISQIPDYAGNPLESRSKAFKLADLMTQQQSNKLLLESQKQEQQDQQKARDIFKKNADSIGTPEGNIKLSQAYAREGMSKQAMQALQFGSEQQTRDLQQQEQKLKLLQFSSDVIGPAAFQIKQTLQTKGLPEAQAMYSAELARILPQLPPGAQHQFPPQLPNDPQQAAALLDRAIGASTQARQMVQQQLNQRKEDTAEARLTETERHNRANEDRQAAAAEQKKSTGFSEEAGDLMAALASRGVSLPTGFRSKDQQKSLYDGLLRRNPGMSPDEIADGIAKGQIEFGAQKKETQTAAGVAGKVEVAQNELEEFIPLVRQASQQVPRGSFVPVNKLLQAGEASISDPNLKALRIRINSVLNAYDMLAARGGTDKDKRAEVRGLITAADSPEALEAGLKSFELEAAAAHRAAIKATKAPELPNTAEGGGAVKPFSDPAKEARYQAWLKAHPNG